jgi:hypothetical protein
MTLSRRQYLKVSMGTIAAVRFADVLCLVLLSLKQEA